MRNRLLWTVVLSALGLLVTPTRAQQRGQRGQGPPPYVKENATVKVSDHVYVIPDDSVPVVPNVGIIVGDKATLVVDTGLGPRNAQTILREVAKVSKNTDMFLVTTHFHPEHAGGAAGFPSSAKFVLARVQQQELDENGGAMMRTFAGFSPANEELLKDVQLRRGDVLFDREQTLDLGSVRAKLTAPGSMHTRGDTLTFIEPDRVLFAGDVVNNRTFLAFGQQANAQTWMDVLAQLDTLKAVKVVPAHGPMGDGSIIGEQRAVLQALQARVRELKTQGRSADEATTTLTAEFQMKYPDWTGPNRVGGAVRSIYAGLP